jgi:hypothetical protein
VSLNLSKTFGLIRPMTRSLLLSTSTLTRFAVNGVEAALALDFIDGEYRTANTSTTFADAFTGTSPKLTYSTAAGSNSTMTNSEGKIVWAPHNLVTYSEDFSQWDNYSLVLDSSTATDPLGGNAAYTYSNFQNANDNRLIATVGVSIIGTQSATFGIWLKGVAGETITIEVANGASSVTLTGSWQYETVSEQSPTSDTIRVINRVGNSNTADVVSVWGAHVYRSDLGGMHPVPGAVGDFQYYVPTNGNAEYLPRVGHHVYNGSTWVNEGLLIESEARTNLFPVSTITAVGVGTDWDGSGSGNGSSVSVASSVEAPDGTTGAVGNFVANAGATGAYFAKDTSLTSGVTYTQSVYAKPNGTNFFQIAPSTGFTSAHYNFDLVNLQTSSSDASIEEVGNGWVRCSVTVPCTITTSIGRMAFAWINSFTAARLDSSAGGAPNGTDGVYLWGAQLEQGQVVNGTPVDAPTPSSYIPTSGSTVTRGGQSLTVPPAQFGWPTPEYIGPELVDNSGFDTGDLTGWGGSATYQEVSGNGTAFIQRSADSTVNTSIELYGDTTGKVLHVTFDVVQGSGDLLINEVETVTATSGQSYSFVIVTTAQNNALVFRARCYAGGSANIDNISVREINPLSVSIQMDGRMTYADDDVDTANPSFVYWDAGSNNYIHVKNNTYGASITGRFDATQDNGTGSAKASVSGNTLFAPGILTPFNISSRHGSTFVNGAVDGVALTEDTTPKALPDLSNTNLEIAQDFMGTIGTFRQFAGDIGDTGLVTATNPSTEPTLSLTFDGTAGGSFYNLNWSE